MRFKYFLPSFFIVAQLIQPANAQSMLGINYPMGMPVSSVSSHSMSLGGTGVGIENDFFGMGNNPANLGSTKRTIFSSSLTTNLLLADDGNTSNRFFDMSIAAISLSVPASRFGTFGFSIAPSGNSQAKYRNVDAIFSTPDFTDLFNDAPVFLDDSVETGIIKKGGSLSWQVAWGYDLLKKVRIGAGVKQFYLDESCSEIIQVRGTMNNRLLDSTTFSFSTTAFRGGIIFPFHSFTFGMSGEYYLINEGKYSRLIEGTHDTVEDITSYKYDFKPPPSLSVGCSYQFNPQWFAALDAGITAWDLFYNQLDRQSFDNAFNVSGGVQFIPAPNLLKPKLYEIMQYRGGLRYAELPGAMGSEVAVTLAAGIPMQANSGMIDIIFDYAQRKDSRFENYRENCFSFKLGINSGRKWFRSGNDSY